MVTVNLWERSTPGGRATALERTIPTAVIPTSDVGRTGAEIIVTDWPVVVIWLGTRGSGQVTTYKLSGCSQNALGQFSGFTAIAKARSSSGNPCCAHAVDPSESVHVAVDPVGIAVGTAVVIAGGGVDEAPALLVAAGPPQPATAATRIVNPEPRRTDAHLRFPINWHLDLEPLSRTGSLSARSTRSGRFFRSYVCTLSRSGQVTFRCTFSARVALIL